MTTIEKIHNEFYTTGENAVLEAKKIIAAPEVDNKKRAERLKRLGFYQSKDCADIENNDKIRREATELIAAFEYWQQHYPGNKFITVDGVKQICKKYGLMLGEASRFCGDIPEKNLLEIEAFKLRKEDFHNEFGFFSSEIIEAISSALFESSNALGRGSFYPRPIHNSLGYRIPESAKPERPAFKICAPQSDFNMEGMEVRDGHILVYDPVVLQPVKNGYLIVTAWGNEASDPLVANEVMN